MYIDWQKANSIISVKNAEDYLFSEQFKRIKSLCDEIVKKRQDKLYTESIIGIVGGRGNGKSSLLKTVRDNLSDYHVLETLDPSVFDDSMSIIELFISIIYKASIALKTDYSNDDIISRIHRQLKNITKLLADFQAGSENFYRETSYGDVLDSIKQRVNLSSLIKELVDNFLKFINENSSNKTFKGLVLCIDDVDLVSNSKIFKLLEDVRKYLAGNIVVITAYNSSQLFDAVLNEKLNENKKLLETNLISVESIKEQVAKYLEKLIPIQHQVRLFDVDNLLDLKFVEVIKDLIETNKSEQSFYENELAQLFKERKLPFSNEISVKNWLYESLNVRIRIKVKPVDMREYTSYNLPNNLRGLMQFIRLIFEDMHVTSLIGDRNEPYSVPLKNDKFYVCAENVLYNLHVFRSYFEKNLSEILPKKFYDIILTWEKSDYSAKNYLICTEILKIINETNKEVLASMPKYYLYNTYNISIGDVYQVLDVYKNSDSIKEKGWFFIFAIKLLYSIELLTYYLRFLLDNKGTDMITETDICEENLNVYLTMINAKILYEGFSYFTEKNSEIISLKYIKDPTKRVKTEGKPFIFDEDTTENIYCKIYYSTEAIWGDLRKAKPQYPLSYPSVEVEKVPSKTKKFWAFRSRKLYETDISSAIENNELRSSSNYPVDPFSFLVQRDYVIKNAFKNAYTFYSLFDIDAMAELFYNRGNFSENEAIVNLLKKVNEVLLRKDTQNVKKSQKYHDSLIKQAMSDSIFYSNDLCTQRNAVYTDNDFLYLNAIFELIDTEKRTKSKGKSKEDNTPLTT
jgi:hypothetical protein